MFRVIVTTPDTTFTRETETLFGAVDTARAYFAQWPGTRVTIFAYVPGIGDGEYVFIGALPDDL